MLNVTKYKHGTRSMKAIIEMSRLAGKNHFDLSALPVKKQLDMHVDAEEFLFLTKKERYQSMLLLKDLPDLDLSESKEVPYRSREEAIIESIAKLMYENFKNRLDEEDRESDNEITFKDFIDAAEDIPNKLWTINQSIRKIKGKIPNTPDITDNELDLLAQLEYERFCRNQRIRESDSKESKICESFTPLLTFFKKRDKKIENVFREFISEIPMILQEAGYEIYRLKKIKEINNPEIVNHLARLTLRKVGPDIYRLEEIGEINDFEIIDSLARLLHNKYIEERMKKEDTLETNSSLVEFDALPQDLKEANFDNARTIPEKLKSIGYDIRCFQQGNENNEINLTEKEIEKIAEMEHSRWAWQKKMQRWVYKKGEKDPEMKTSPYIVPWKKLEPDIKDNDRNTVCLIPKLLKEAGYEAYKPDPEKNG
jgi:hypothetical protein